MIQFSTCHTIIISVNQHFRADIFNILLLYLYSYAFPYNYTTCTGHSIYHEFTGNLITLILVYEYKYKEQRFFSFQSKTFFY